MKNVVREYLTSMNDILNEKNVSYIVTAVKLPNGAIELATNSVDIKKKIEYILGAYDENMRLKTNPNIVMRDVMIV